MKLSEIHTDEKVASYFRGLLILNTWNIISFYKGRTMLHIFTRLKRWLTQTLVWIFGIYIFFLQMSEADFQAVPEVEIDTGVFKYVLIRLYRFLETEIVIAGGIKYTLFKKTLSASMMLMLLLSNNAFFLQGRWRGQNGREGSCAGI